MAKEIKDYLRELAKKDHWKVFEDDDLRIIFYSKPLDCSELQCPDPIMFCVCQVIGSEEKSSYGIVFSHFVTHLPVNALKTDVSFPTIAGVFPSFLIVNACKWSTSIVKHLFTKLPGVLETIVRSFYGHSDASREIVAKCATASGWVLTLDFEGKESTPAKWTPPVSTYVATCTQLATYTNGIQEGMKLSCDTFLQRLGQLQSEFVRDSWACHKGDIREWASTYMEARSRKQKESMDSKVSESVPTPKVLGNTGELETPSAFSPLSPLTEEPQNSSPQDPLVP